jgi:hypothetical protein
MPRPSYFSRFYYLNLQVLTEMLPSSVS